MAMWPSQAQALKVLSPGTPMERTPWLPSDATLQVVLSLRPRRQMSAASAAPN